MEMSNAINTYLHWSSFYGKTAHNSDSTVLDLVILGNATIDI
jgi:hypothetical protein